ncbi:MAG: OB-fold nucleic acid binding domain-containing protein, partial [Chitinophagales bacterium]
MFRLAHNMEIKKILKDAQEGDKIEVKGWVRTFRSNQFVALNDGSTIENLQLVVDFNKFDDALLKRITTSAAIVASGVVASSQGKGQRVELKVDTLDVVGDSDPEKYLIQPKKHSLEFLRENAHLRFRTNMFGAIFRIRHHLAIAIHKYFDQLGYF